MPHFPMFVDLQGRPILVVGGGAVALRKLQKLAPFGPKPTVVAPEILPEIAAIPGAVLRRRPFHPRDLRPRPELVIAATNDKAINHEISELCRRRHIPVNVADDPEACTFLFPALVQQGNFSAGISTGGASPAAAVYVKERLQALLPEHLEDILIWLEAKRPELKAAIPEQSKRASAFRKLFDECLVKGAPLTQEETQRCLTGLTVGSVALVGAGCGKADLITVRGRKLLQQCQAVVYDDLIDPALLDAVPESAQRIYMGKRSGAHSASQDEINQELIRLARSGLQVVRLKGGDPYLFGRGGEEMVALQAAGIPCLEVPGIPSAIGIPAEAGIPVTHRGASRGLHIITAQTSGSPDGLPEDFDQLAKLSGTLVFLMGLRQLPKIVERLMAAGKSGSTPAAVISGGNSPKPALVRSPLSHLAQAAADACVGSPAIILVGEVAAMDLSAAAKPLKGIRVGITGTEQVAEKQRLALEALGAETVWAARSAVKARPEALDWSAFAGKPGWIVFTSPNGVRVFFEKWKKENQDLPLPDGKKYAVIGAATEEALSRFGIRADLCPKTFTSEALAIALAAEAKEGETIFLLRSSIGSPVLPMILKKSGFDVQDVPLYDLEPTQSEAASLPKLDYLTFSSASGVELFFRCYGSLPAGVHCVCIGGTTADALSRHTDIPFLTAGEISAAGIVKAILDDRAEYTL